LVAEDEPHVLRIIQSVLTRNGYQVLTADSGPAALSLCEKHSGPIHLLLTDVVMPRFSGKELAQQLAGLRPDTRVIFMSGDTDELLTHHDLGAGGVTLLRKPFPSSQLLSVVRQTLGSRAESAGRADRR
jgi:hypothetical protein